MNNIHPTALIGPDVVLGDNITIEPYAVLDGKITMGDNVRVGPHAHLTGWVTIGAGTRIYASACIGEEPQDYSYDGTPGLVEIGRDCLIREGVTIHTPVHGEQGEKTVVADKVFLMANCHVAHNVKVGEGAVIANGCLLAGYTIVEEFCFLSGNIGCHQNCRVGAYSIVGACSKIAQDIPPFAMADGHPSVTHGINFVGLRRRGITADERARVKDAYKILYSGIGMKDAAKAMVEKYPDCSYVKRLSEFVLSSKRGIISGHAE